MPAVSGFLLVGAIEKESQWHFMSRRNKVQKQKSTTRCIHLRKVKSFIFWWVRPTYDQCNPPPWDSGDRPL